MNPSVPGPSSSPCWSTSESEAVQRRAARTARRVRRAGAAPRGRGDPAPGAPPDARAAPAPGLHGRPDPEAALARSVPGLRGRRPRADPGGQPGEPLRIRHAPAAASATWPLTTDIAPPSRSPVRSADLLVGPVRHVLGTIAHIGSAQPSDAARAFALGIQALGWPGIDPSLPPRNLDLQALDQRLNELDAAVPPLKRQILNACAACIGADGRVTARGGRAAPRHRRRAGMPRPAAPVARGCRGGQRQSPGLMGKVRA